MVHDPLYLRCVAFEYEGEMAFLLCYDMCGMHTDVANQIREKVAAYVGCPAENVVLSCTHTHTGPNVVNKTHDYDADYEDVLTFLSMHAAGLAKNDLAPAQMFIGSKEAKGISFCRRYLMKDGSARTNPGVGNPDILRPMNDPDPQVQVLKIVREGAKDLALVNFGCHADSIKNVGGLDAISADWPGVTVNTVEGALDVNCVMFNGPCGDVAQRNQMDPNDNANSPYDAQFVLYLTNGSAGYFPMRDAFNYDGYEARTCKFQPGVGELLADTAMNLLNNIK